MNDDPDIKLAPQCDVLVIGAGAGGLATAITAQRKGLHVQVVEKAGLVGGCTALSYGTLWVPGSPVAAREGLQDDLVAARTYLQHELGERFDPTLVDAYLGHAPRAIEFFERETALRFECRSTYPDYHVEQPGAALGGRTIVVAPFDGRALGAAIARLRPPLPTQTLMGMMFSPKEVPLLQNWLGSWAAFKHVFARFARHLADLTLHGRTMWLTNGNALAARLLHTALTLRLPIHTGVALRELVVRDGAVIGAVLEQGGQQRVVQARLGVVLACGGFSHDLQRCQALFSRPQLDGENWSLAPRTNTGDGLRAAQARGAQIERNSLNAAFWSPVSRLPHRGGQLAGHYHERQRPGFIAVLRNGQRFANEAQSYHHFGEAIVKATPSGCEPEAFLICDHASLRRTGMGNAILPRPFPLGAHLRAGYLMRGDTLEALARCAGIDEQGLRAAVERFNRFAREGHDPDFGKGGNAYDRFFVSAADSAKANEKPNERANGNLGPLGTGPYYAVRITAAHMATLAGLVADAAGRVLDAQGAPIPGLYAAGNDRSNVFAGACPGGGITLGPALTFGYLTALHLADEAERRAATPSPAPMRPSPARAQADELTAAA